MRKPSMLGIKDITKRFGLFSITDVSFSVRKGEYFILLGDSGAGKSLLLEMIAGLVEPDSGKIFMDEREITRQKIQERGIGLVFQDYAVFPHLTVRENVGYSLHGSHLDHAEKRERIRAISVKMNIVHLLDRKPSSLSGGEQQRVALARTLVQNPKVLLLDEPLSSLDPKLRSEIRSLLRQLNREGLTVIHVTHDYEEAVSLADTIAVVYDGRIIQAGSPEEVFAHPKSEFVAHFIGIRNFFKARVIKEHGQVHGLVGGKLAVNLCPGEYSEEGFILIRNEDIILSKSIFDSSVTNSFKGTVTEIVPSRIGVEVTVDIGVPVYASITEQSLQHLGIHQENEVFVSFKATAVKFIEA
jgi:molybdopterin-binding protein